jgi:hypothetical protein
MHYDFSPSLFNQYLGICTEGGAESIGTGAMLGAR